MTNAPNSRKTHVIRILGTNEDGDVLPDIWLDIERMDECRAILNNQNETDSAQGLNRRFQWIDDPQDPNYDEEKASKPDSRHTALLKICSPDEEDQANPTEWVPVEVVQGIRFRRDDGSVTNLRFVNDAINDSRISDKRKITHFDTSMDDDAQAAFDADPDLKVFVVKGDQYTKDPDTEDESQFVEHEIIHSIMERRSRTEEQTEGNDQGKRITLLNQYQIDESRPAELEVTGQDGFNPPWRLDPFQNIVNVQFATTSIWIAGGGQSTTYPFLNPDQSGSGGVDTFVGTVDPTVDSKSFYDIHDKNGVVLNEDQLPGLVGDTEDQQTEVDDQNVNSSTHSITYAPNNCANITCVALSSPKHNKMAYGQQVTFASPGSISLPIVGSMDDMVSVCDADSGAVIATGWPATGHADTDIVNGTFGNFIYEDFEPLVDSAPISMTFDSKGDCIVAGFTVTGSATFEFVNDSEVPSPVLINDFGLNLYRYGTGRVIKVGKWTYEVSLGGQDALFLGVSTGPKDIIAVCGPRSFFANDGVPANGPTDITILSSSGGLIKKLTATTVWFTSQTRFDSYGNVYASGIVSDGSLSGFGQSQIVKFDSNGDEQPPLNLITTPVFGPPQFDIAPNGKIFAAAVGSPTVFCFEASQPGITGNALLWQTDVGFEIHHLAVLGNNRLVVDDINNWEIFTAASDGTLTSVATGQHNDFDDYSGFPTGITDLQRSYRTP